MSDPPAGDAARAAKPKKATGALVLRAARALMLGIVGAAG